MEERRVEDFLVCTLARGERDNVDHLIRERRVIVNLIIRVILMFLVVWKLSPCLHLNLKRALDACVGEPRWMKSS